MVLVSEVCPGGPKIFKARVVQQLSITQRTKTFFLRLFIFIFREQRHGLFQEKKEENKSGEAFSHGSTFFITEYESLENTSINNNK